MQALYLKQLGATLNQRCEQGEFSDLPLLSDEVGHDGIVLVVG